jgi:ABC-type multidrug transport system fused ATPase/permease subunit
MKKVLRELFSILSPHYRRRVLQLQVGAIIQALLDAIAFGLLYPLLQLLTESSTAKQSQAVVIAGDFLGTHEVGPLKVRLGITIIVFFVLSSLCGIVLSRAQSKVVANSEADVASRLFNSYLHAPYLEQIQRNSGELNRNVVSACIDVHQSALMGFLVLGENIFTVSVLVIVLAIINPLVTLVAVIYFLVAAYLYARVISPRSMHAGERMLEISGVTYKASQEGFQGLKAFQASDSIEAVAEEYGDKRRELAHHRFRSTYYGLLPQYYMQSAMIGGIVIFCLVIALAGATNVTAMVGLIVAASIRLLPCLYQMLSSVNRIRNGGASVHEIYSDLSRLDVDRTPPASPEAAQQPADTGRWDFADAIVFDRVGFIYPNAIQEALRDVSLVIRKGSSVGIVGPSGAGKTTMVDLLLGLFPPSRGGIFLDGDSLSGEMIGRWRRQVAYVPQEIFLLDGTVSENVCFDKSVERIDDAAVWHALERAHVADFIAELPDGIETVVGERGVLLSAGQRQRIGIARALYRQPAALILDEATSALDTATEAAFAETVEQLRGTLTLITVAHRLSTVRHCDTIFLIEGGRLVAEGTFESLRRDSGLFDKMARLANIESA